MQSISLAHHCVDGQCQQIADNIDDELVFAAIKAALAARFSGFDRLTINHNRRWFRLAP